MIDEKLLAMYAEFKQDLKSQFMEDVKVEVTKLFHEEFDKEQADNFMNEFFKRGGTTLIYEKCNSRNIFDSIENNTIPIIQLLKLCEASKGLKVKSTDAISKGRIEFPKPSIDLLHEILIEGLKAKRVPLFNGNWETLIKKCQEWSNEKKSAEDVKHIENYFLFTFGRITDFIQFKSLTEKYIFVYKLAIAYGFLYDNSCDLTNGADRKEIVDMIKYRISAYERWRKKNPKHKNS